MYARRYKIELSNSTCPIVPLCVLFTQWYLYEHHNSSGIQVCIYLLRVLELTFLGRGASLIAFPETIILAKGKIFIFYVPDGMFYTAVEWEGFRLLPFIKGL